MPLTPIQRLVVRVLRPFRTEQNYVAGGAALNQRWPRLSDDMDIFRDVHDQLPNAVEPELEALREAGYSVEVTTSDDWMVEAIVRRFGLETQVQWQSDSETCRRFFPAVADEEFGFRLHQADNAVNKVLCASSREEPRDAVDLLNIVQRYAMLGPLVWAAAAKNDTVSPLQIVSDIRARAFGFSEEEVRTVRMEDGSEASRTEVRSVLEPALAAAINFCEDLAPIEFAGHLFVDVNEAPIEASGREIADGTASPMPLKSFSPLPTVSD